jgi:hypothetical protein
MQLKQKPALRHSLTAATCTLLGSAPIGAVDAQEALPWQLDTALLFYGEQDGRVKDTSLNALARKEFDDEHFLDLKLAIDSLTGASPSGALRADVPQTFTTPSGGDAYTIAPGELPLDSSFLDTRVALSANWQQPFGDVATIDLGVNVSDEYDYTSFGISARYARDLNKNNTTLSAGIAFASDDIDPVGGAPVPFAFMRGADGDDAEDDSNRLGSGSKDTTDFLLGISQVLSRRLIVQLNYSLSDSSGYLNDPYKILSVLDAGTGLPAPGSDGLYAYLYENRPDSRQKQSLFGKLKYRFDSGTLDVSYRFMTDDWKIDSSTAELRYRWDLPGAGYVEPHLRLYTQTAAEFYRTSLTDGEPLPQYASADYRLGEFDAVTVGIKYGRVLANGNEWNVRLEQYSTSGSGPDSAVYPDMEAVIFQTSYNFALGGWR